MRSFGGSVLVAKCQKKNLSIILHDSLPQGADPDCLGPEEGQKVIDVKTIVFEMDKILQQDRDVTEDDSGYQ